MAANVVGARPARRRQVGVGLRLRHAGIGPFGVPNDEHETLSARDRRQQHHDAEHTGGDYQTPTRHRETSVLLCWLYHRRAPA